MDPWSWLRSKCEYKVLLLVPLSSSTLTAPHSSSKAFKIHRANKKSVPVSIFGKVGPD